MNTTTAAEAAIQAHVSVATVRAWCRTGVVAATKAAGRWVIDTASLARRLAIGALKAARRRSTKPVVFSVETMTAIGGNRWTKAGRDRVYLNDWHRFAGLAYSCYGTGNIASASYQGGGISNSQAYKILRSIDKVWFDSEDNKLHCRYGFGESRVATAEELWGAVVAGVRTAIAAL